MLRLLFSIVLVVFFSVSDCLAETTWQSIGPYGGNIGAIVIDPSNSQTVYAGTSFGNVGFYKSNNGGASWSLTNSSIPAQNISTSLIDPHNPQIIYIGTYGNGIFKSIDGGITWGAINNGIIEPHDIIFSIAIDPLNNEIVYAGTQYGGLYKSIDGGGGWAAKNTGMLLDAADSAVSSIAIDPKNSQTIYSATNHGLFKSINGGDSWIVVNNEIGINSITIDPVNSLILYTGTWTGVYTSSDGGTTWNHPDKNTTGVKLLVIDPTNNHTLYVTTFFDGIYKSTDSGTSWSTSNTGINVFSAVKTLAIDPANGNTLYAGTEGGGVFKSINAGASWSTANNGITNTAIQSFAIDRKTGETVYAGTLGGWLFKWNNGDASWTTVNNGIAKYSTVISLAIDGNDGQIVYSGTDNSGIFKTIDGGAQWNAANKGIPPSAAIHTLAIASNDSQTLFAGTDGGGIYKSIDGGASWQTSSNGLTTTFKINCFAINPTDNQTVYAGTDGDGIYKSTDGGATWKAVNSGLTFNPVLPVSTIVIDPTNVQTLYAGTGGNGLLKSTNGGDLWIAANNGIPVSVINPIVMDPHDSQKLYAGSYGTIVKTSDGGASWTTAIGDISGTPASALAGSWINFLAIDPSNSQTVYASSDSGVFRTESSNAPIITSSTTVTFSTGIAGTYILTASGTPAPSFSVTGMLPGGLVFDPSTGTLTGTPASGTAGIYNLLFTASNGIPPDATRGVTLTVLPNIPLNVVITSPATGSKNATLTSITGTASGSGLARVELQVTDGIYYLQPNNTFSTTPAWITASGTDTWTLNTGNVIWIDGITYTISARASDGTLATKPVSSNIKILAPSNKAYTQLSLNFTPPEIKGGDTTVASGQIIRLPDDGSSLAGLAITLLVTPPSTAANPTPSVVILPMTTTDTGAFTSGPLSQFTTPGVYTVQVRFDGNSTLAACSTVPEPFYVNIQSGYAIVVTGKSPDNSLLEQHTATTDTVISTLKERGFLAPNITYLKSTESTSVTKQQIQEAITVWARNKLAAAPAPLYIIMIDHGVPDGFVLDSARLTPDDLKGYLEIVEADPAVIASGALASFKRFIIIGSCYSGIFASKLSKPGRVVITSAAEDEESLAGVNVFGNTSGNLYGGEYFIDTLFTFLKGGETFKDAFNEAKNAVKVRDPRQIPAGNHHGSYDTLAQHPLLDDDGDTKPSYLLNGTDGIVTASLTLGEGIKINAMGNPADIIAVAPIDSLAISASAKQLWLKVNTNSRVSRAWVEIRRPGIQTTGGGSGQVIPFFDMIPLIYDGNNWIGNYTKFDIAGAYDIFYYTKDNQTDAISPAVHSKVYKQLASNSAPSSFSLLTPTNQATTDPMFPLTWQESTDSNGLTYSLLVSTDQSFNTIVYREDDIPQNTTYISKDTLKNPASTTGGYYCQNGDTYCYWKVQAIDNYGAITESNVRSFTIVQTNALPGIFAGYVFDTGTGKPIANATISSNGGLKVNSSSNGAFLMSQPAGSYTLTAAATSHTTASVSANAVAGKVIDVTLYLADNTTTTPVNGVCGSNNGGTFTVAPATDLCATGTATTLTGNGPWSWSCQGSNGGTNGSCSANKQTDTATITLMSQATLSATYKTTKGTIKFTATGNPSAIDIQAKITADNWITIGAIKIKNGTGTIAFTVSANPGLSRNGAINVGGNVISITQDAMPCKITSVTASPATVPVVGGTVTLNVTVTPEVCSWSVTTIKAGGEWMTNLTGTSVTGNGSINGSAAQNTTGKARTTTVILQTADGKAKKNVLVKQEK